MPIYLHYADDTMGARVLNVYQVKSGANGASDKWISWKLYQYSGGNTAWTVNDCKSGKIQKIALETSRNDWVLEDGTGDSGSWADYTSGSIIAKNRITNSGYNQYSAYATYTAIDDYDDVKLSFNKNAACGIIRIKINDVVSTSGEDLGEAGPGTYDCGAHGTDDSQMYWIHIASDISAGEVIKIEVMGDASGDEHRIGGLRFYQDVNPGDSGWKSDESHVLFHWPLVELFR